MSTVLPPHLSFSHVDRTCPNPHIVRRIGRRDLKRSLMEDDPHCSHCGCHLTSEPDRTNSAFLIFKWLSCPNHVKAVRQRHRDERDERRANREHRRNPAARKQDPKPTDPKWALLEHDPHCFACGCRVTAKKHQRNTAKVIRKRLSCPDHIELVSAGTKLGPEIAVRTIGELDDIRRFQDRWLVDGIPFYSLSDAEQQAIELAKMLGCKIEIFVDHMDGLPPTKAEVVRPGDDARFREDSYHRERRSVMDVVRWNPRMRADIERQARAWNEYADRKNAEFERTIRPSR